MNDIFENNKQNLLLINEIVANYRKQNFFVGSLKLSALLKNINSVVEVIFSREDCRDLAGPLRIRILSDRFSRGKIAGILQESWSRFCRHCCRHRVIRIIFCRQIFWKAICFRCYRKYK